MLSTVLRAAPLWLLFIAAGCASPSAAEGSEHDMHASKDARSVPVQYLELVTPDVDATCSALAKAHGVTFGAPVPELGNARTAALRGGGSIGVRAPLRETERPVVRPYALVEDIVAEVEAVRAAGAEIALPPLEIPGHGQFAIYFLGGIEHGLWQL